MKSYAGLFAVAMVGAIVILIFEPHDFWSVLLGAAIGGSIIAIVDGKLILLQQNRIEQQQLIIDSFNEMLTFNREPIDRENAVYEELGP